MNDIIPNSIGSLVFDTLGNVICSDGYGLKHWSDIPELSSVQVDEDGTATLQSLDEPVLVHIYRKEDKVIAIYTNK